MSVKATKGLTIHMSGTTAPTVVSLATADEISNAKPAVVKIASTTGLADGQMVTIDKSGWSELDGKTFIVANLVADTSLELQGSDTSAQASALVMGAAPLVTLTTYADADLIALCLSGIGINPETASPVSVATFCDPTATIAGLEAGAGTLDLTFYLDKDSTGYAALLAAEADGNERMFKIVFPDNGSLVLRGTVSSLVFTDIPLEGSVALNAQVTLSTKPVHIF